MTHIIEQQNLYLKTTKQRIVCNLNDIDDEINFETHDDVNMEGSGTTIREMFMKHLDNKGNTFFHSIEHTNNYDVYQLLFDESNTEQVDTLLGTIDESLDAMGDWDNTDSHYIFHLLDKTWRLVVGNANGINPYGGSADLISVMERLKLLKTGTVTFQETNLEWHSKGYRDEFQKLLVKAFGAARMDHITTKDKFETSPFKPGGTISAALGKMVHRVVKTGRDDTGGGRWLYITFNGKENNHITVINTYRV
jgi:hypothetical protein